MKTFVVANWKCSPITILEAQRLFGSVQKGILNVKNTEVIICPPSAFLCDLAKLKNRIQLGGQDCFWEQKGAFTGATSAGMLKSAGCTYVIIGHSERRRIFNETDEIINKKLKNVFEVNLKPIFCVGETKDQREKGETQSILKRQIEQGLAGIPQKLLQRLSIAYEPVWAISPGDPCDPHEAQCMGGVIRKIISELYSPHIAQSVPVLYGGSVNAKNAASYVESSGLQGLLVGAASLKASEFVEIIKNVDRS